MKANSTLSKIITKVNCRYGAPMGRPAYGHGEQPSTPFELRRIRINQGGYDDGGAYWGTGQPLYWYYAYTETTVDTGRCLFCNQGVRSAQNGDCRDSSNGEHKFETTTEEVEISDYIRADSREHAKAIVVRKYPNARFKR